MVDEILNVARAGLNVCVAVYGHPGVFAFPSHEAVRRARQEGIPAKMLSGVSAEDCLFADLGVEPGNPGIQSYDATDFLVYGRKVDNTSRLILWQIGVIGDLTYREDGYDLSALLFLADYYTGDHNVIIYEASVLPIYEPRAEQITIRDLPDAVVNPVSTLYVPPLRKALPDPEMLKIRKGESDRREVIAERTVAPAGSTNAAHSLGSPMAPSSGGADQTTGR